MEQINFMPYSTSVPSLVLFPIFEVFCHFWLQFDWTNIIVIPKSMSYQILCVSHDLKAFYVKIILEHNIALLILINQGKII